MSEWVCRGLVAALLWLMTPGQAFADVMELRHAQATLNVGGQTLQREVQLPYSWDKEHHGLRGLGLFEITFSLDVLPSEPYAAYFVRLGNAYAVSINGILLQDNGQLDRYDTEDFAKVPRLVLIPPQMLAQHNVLLIQIRSDSGRRSGVPVVRVGPVDEVMRLYDQSALVRITLSQLSWVTSLLVGFMALTLWSLSVTLQESGPQRDRLYLAVALAEIAWSLNVGQVLIERSIVPWPWWSALMILMMAFWTYWLMDFFVQIADWSELPLLRRARPIALLLLAAGPFVAFFSVVYEHTQWLTLWYGAAAMLYISFCTAFCAWTWRYPNTVRYLMTAVLVVTVAAGVRDWWLFRIGSGFGENTLLRYVTLVFGAALASATVMRFREVSAQAHNLMLTLSEQVNQKERELQINYERMEKLAHEQVRVNERSRILRDMHDGVGSHISSAIRQLQSGKAEASEVLQTLRDSLDQLKLTIDSMNLPDGDITALLANLRYRLEPRFAASDIRLEWDVDLVEPIERLDAQAMRQLQFIVFEAMSNVLQHAHASVLTIALHAKEGTAVLKVIDNGRGFDVHGHSRRGLRSMYERATAIGAILDVSSEPGRTAVQLALV